MTENVAAVIPARLASTRLPSKPLLRDTGKFLIQHVYERVAQAQRIGRVIVATDDESIVKAVESFGGEAVMTDIAHQSGTDRVAEVISKLPDVTHILNIQGDEPEIDKDELDRVAAAIVEKDAEMVTLATPILDPGVYKDIHTVMAAQEDLVEVLGRFEPRIVKMAPAGEKPED